MSAAVLLCLVRALSAVSRLSLGPLLPILSADFAIELVAKGQLLSAFSTGYLLTQVVGGRLADVIGAKGVVTYAMAATAVGLAAAPLVALEFGIFGLSAVYFVMGIVNGPLFPACSVMLRTVEEKGRAKAMAIVDMGGTIGGCLGTSLCPALAMFLGWANLYRMLAAAAGGMTLLWAYCATDPSAEDSNKVSAGETTPAQTKPKQPSAKSSPMQLFMFAGPWALFCAHAIFNYSNYFLNAWLPTMFVERFEMDAAVVGGYLIWPEAVGVASRLGAAMVTERFFATGSGIFDSCCAKRSFMPCICWTGHHADLCSAPG